MMGSEGMRALNTGKAMIKRNTRIAYLKRMLRRLEGEDVRIKQLIESGQLPREAAGIAFQQLSASREELMSELHTLQAETDASNR